MIFFVCTRRQTFSWCLRSEITSFFQSTSAVVRQQEQACSEKGISQQLQVLQVQDLTRTSQMPSSDHQVKRHCVDNSEQVSQKKQGSELHPPMPVRGHSDQQPAHNSGGLGSEPSMGVGEAQSMKTEAGHNDLVNQAGTDPFWRSNSLTQATQVKLVVTKLHTLALDGSDMIFKR
jgi:hypothetical protein